MRADAHLPIDVGPGGMKEHRVVHEDGDKEEPPSNRDDHIIISIVQHHIRLDALVELQSSNKCMYICMYCNTRLYNIYVCILYIPSTET